MNSQHCPGFERNKSLEAVLCRCPDCGKEVEVFTDEEDRNHKCSSCGTLIDFTKCMIDNS